MAHRPKYHLPASSHKRGGGFLWLFVALVAGIVITVWWMNRKPALRMARPASLKVRAQTNTNAVVSLPPSNTPVSSSVSPSPVVVVPKTNGPVAVGFPRPPRDTLEAQVALMRRGFSAGSIDGVSGSQTRAAVMAFQKSAFITATGELDATTRTALALDSPVFTNHVVTSNDLARLQPVSATWLGKSRQTALDYETILELVAEVSHASPNLIKRLNPGVDWTNICAGAELRVPDAKYPPARKAALLTISLSEKRLQAFDDATNVLVHFPCSIASRVEKRPVGELHVVTVAPDPDYTFNPEVFPESAEARELKGKLMLPPGPNNPVGLAWISLDRPGYGIHGTPKPEDVGRTESHGCFRLANWNAQHLLQMVTVGMPVIVEP